MTRLPGAVYASGIDQNIETSELFDNAIEGLCCLRLVRHVEFDCLRRGAMLAHCRGDVLQSLGLQIT